MTMSLKQLIESLKVDEIIQEVEPNVFRCKCAPWSFKRSSLRGHLKSGLHIAFFDSNKKECGICYEFQKEFWTCEKCKNQHCIGCHEQIRGGKCPFCRHVYQEQPRPNFFEPLYFHFIDNDIPLPPLPPLRNSLSFDFDDELLPLGPPPLERQDAIGRLTYDLEATRNLLEYLNTTFNNL